MQNDKIYSDIVGLLVRTRFEANQLLAELDVLERALFKIGDGDFNSTIQKSIRISTANALSKIFATDSKEIALKTLRDHVNALKYLRLTIAYEPTSESIEKIFIWIKQNIGPGIAMELTYDKTILGGAVIEYAGKIQSYTLKQKVDNYFLTHNVNV